MDGIVFLGLIAILFIVLGLAATAFGVDSRPDFEQRSRPSYLIDRSDRESHLPPNANLDE